MASIAVVMPAYRVARQIVPLIALIPPAVTRIIVVDDASPEHSGALVGQQGSDPRVADPARTHSGRGPRLHVHQVVAKITRSRRWRVSLNGRRVMAAAVKLREVAYPSLYAEAP
jgi:hypothetical protein